MPQRGERAKRPSGIRSRHSCRRLPGVLTILVLAAYLSGCGEGLSPRGNGDARAQASMRSHGEAVFRLQNEQMDRLIAAELLLGDDSQARSAVLFAAEDRIVTSCHALNEAAGVVAGGGAVSIAAKARVLLSLSNCESSARAAKAVLEQDAQPVMANLR